MAVHGFYGCMSLAHVLFDNGDPTELGVFGRQAQLSETHHLFTAANSSGFNEIRLTWLPQCAENVIEIGYLGQLRGYQVAGSLGL